MKTTHTAYKAKWTVKFKRHGARIKDALKPRRFLVTEKDIDHAVCRDHQNCAFARAIKRATGADWVDVSTSRVLIKTGIHTAKRYLLPPLAREQVRYFDTHEAKMAPCLLELAVPQKHDTLGARTKRNRFEKRIGGHSPTKPGRKPTR